ncbi:MAG: fructose-bisphosphatase class II family protein [Chloroflexi bacterium]|nr:MAG: fructose-bisphosphatase class II family protein [Chloroflexota bacterium]TME16970.1 MAG: fructose-bisphosphatase class II family protein [Chloroflexota bacterium]TME19396.1 MAG: fructose-bisphosphatase class II family protein [Chloroflexota bacterium]
MERELTDRLPVHETATPADVDLVRVTEAAALAAARFTGRGDQDRVKSVAASAMLQALEELGMGGRVILGPRGDGILSVGSIVGVEGGFDFGVYPVEGASLVSRGLPNAISMVVAGPPGCFPSLPAVAYMEKAVVGAPARGALDLDDGVADNLRRVAFARDCRVADLTVAVLDRPRHQGLIEEVRAAGARILNLEDGDITGGLLAAADWTGVDAMLGIGGLQEAIMAACAVSCLGGDVQCRLWPRNDEERILAGEDGARLYGAAELVPEGIAVAITGVTGGALLGPVFYGGGFAQTQSLILNARTGTVRRVTTRHQVTRPAS